MSQSQNPKVRKERSLIHKLDYGALGKKERQASGKDEMVRAGGSGTRWVIGWSCVCP